MILSLWVLIGALLFTTPAWSAPRYWVSSSAADDSASCSAINSQTDPGVYKKTILGGWNCMTDGVEQTLTIKAGTYTSSWHNAAHKSGVDAAHRTIIEGFSGAGSPGCAIALTCNTTIIKTSTGQSVDSVSHVTFRYMKFDGSSESFAACAPTSSCGATVRFSGTGTDIEMYDYEITAGPAQGVFTTTGISSFHSLRHNIHDHALDTHQGLPPPNNSNAAHAFYLGGNNHIVENGRMVAIGNGAVTSNSYGIQCYASGVRSNNCIIRNNDIHGNTNGIIANGNNTWIYNNLIYGNQVRGIDTGYAGTPSSPTGIVIANNLIYNNGSYAIRAGNSGTSETIISINNIVLGNAGSPGTNQYHHDEGSPTFSITTDKNTGVITDCTVSSSVFTQTASSTCLNAGTPVTSIGLAYNDSNPDQGAFEKITFATASVENGDASNLRITFNNSAHPPLLPATGITGFTARKNGGANFISGTCSVVGTNRVDCPLSSAVATGNTIDFSASGTNVTDSARMGYTINQPLVQTLTNQTVTNNVGAGSSAVFTQTVFRFNGLRGTEAAPVATPYAAAPENTNILIVPGGSVRLRVGISCTSADCPPTGFIPLYSRNGGTYTVIPDTFGADNIAFCGTGPDPDIPTSGTSTTQQLTGSGTFAAGALVRTSNAIPTVDMALNGRTEIEWCLTTNSTVTATDIFQIRAFKQGSPATAIDGYSVTPKMTVTAAQAGRGF